MSNFIRKVRPRACALVVRNQALLMVKVRTPLREYPIWLPPGGGVEFGESLRQTAEREVLEESFVHIKAKDLMYIHELIEGDIHAHEYYFIAEDKGGEAALGCDPERMEDPLLLDYRFIPFDELDHFDIYPEFLRTDFSQRYLTKDFHTELITSQCLK